MNKLKFTPSKPKNKRASAPKSNKTKSDWQRAYDLSYTRMKATFPGKTGSQKAKFILLFETPKHLRFLIRFKKYLRVVFETGENTDSLVDNYIALYKEMAITEGPYQAVKLLKEVYSFAQRYTVSHIYERVPFRKSHRDGLPFMVSFLREFLRGSKKQRRCALSVLQLFKIAVYPAVWPSLNSITLPDLHLAFNQRTFPNEISYLDQLVDLQNKGVIPMTPDLDLSKFARSWKISIKEMFPKGQQNSRIQFVKDNTQLHTSTRNGPNGQALLSIPMDYLSLSPTLRTAQDKLIALLDFKDLAEILNKFDTEHTNLVTESNRKQPPIHSRLSLKTEPGVKGRVFAIADYFSQSVMTGIHKLMFSTISTYEEDGTFDQGRISRLNQRYTLEGREGLASHDLRTATDRIQALMMAEIVEAMLGVEIASEWFTIMTQRDFLAPQTGESVRYAKGQPMGILSSWPALALWHHAIYRAILIYLGISRKQSTDVLFSIIGDDSSSINKLVAAIYELVLWITDTPVSPLKGYTDKSLDMSLNPLKGEELKVSRHSVVEIAKRVYIDGYEMTPTSPVLVLDAMFSTSSFRGLLQDLDDRQILDCETVKNALPTLVQLSLKPVETIHCVTFPLWPVPLALAGLGKNGPTTKESEELFSQVIWFTSEFDLKTLKEQTEVYLRQQLNDTIASFYDNVNSFMSIPDSEKIENSRWDYPGKFLETPCELIYMAFQRKFTKLFLSQDLISSNLKIALEGGGSSELLKALQTSLRLIFDIDAIFDKPEDRESAFNKLKDEFPLKVYKQFMMYRTQAYKRQ